jgi:hypothetical protein
MSRGKGRRIKDRLGKGDWAELREGRTPSRAPDRRRCRCGRELKRRWRRWGPRGKSSEEMCVRLLQLKRPRRWSARPMTRVLLNLRPLLASSVLPVRPQISCLFFRYSREKALLGLRAPFLRRRFVIIGSLAVRQRARTGLSTRRLRCLLRDELGNMLFDVLGAVEPDDFLLFFLAEREVESRTTIFGDATSEKVDVECWREGSDDFFGAVSGVFGGSRSVLRDVLMSSLRFCCADE